MRGWWGSIRPGWQPARMGETLCRRIVVEHSLFRFVILGLDPRIHAGMVVTCAGGTEKVALRPPLHAAAMFRHGSQGLRLRFATAPPWDDEEATAK